MRCPEFSHPQAITRCDSSLTRKASKSALHFQGYRWSSLSVCFSFVTARQRLEQIEDSHHVYEPAPCIRATSRSEFNGVPCGFRRYFFSRRAKFTRITASARFFVNLATTTSSSSFESD